MIKPQAAKPEQRPERKGKKNSSAGLHVMCFHIGGDH